MSKCEQKITGYLNKTKQISDDIPFGSKYFGMAFIPEGDSWPVCDNCQREMILVVQLLVSDLPEVPEWLDLNDEDMLQIFTCGYIDPYSEDIYWNKHTNSPKVKENQRCFHSYYSAGKYSHKNKKNTMILKNEMSIEFEKIAHEFFYGYSYKSNEYCNYEQTLHNAYYPLLFVPRVVNTKNKKPIIYESLPWIDSYFLKRSDDGSYTDILKGVKANNEIINHMSVSYNETKRSRIIENLSDKSLKIIGWEKFSYQCNKSTLAHKIFNGCFSHGREEEIEGLLLSDIPTSYYLGALTILGHSIFGRYEIGVYPNCMCCSQPMRLLFSFSPQDGYYLQSLFYCEETGYMKVTCVDERSD